MERLISDGLDVLSGALAEAIAEDFKSVGALLSIDDLNEFQPRRVPIVADELAEGPLTTWWPPTQGVISLAILGILERGGIRAVRPDSADHIHCVLNAPQTGIQIARMRM